MATDLVDAFALLGQPRRPWLEPDVVKDAFHRLSAGSHPDAARSSGPTLDFTVLNRAQSVLTSPKLRLRHLLELEFAELLSRDQRTPPALGDLFLEVAEQIGAANAWRKKLDRATTPLAQALLAPERLALRAQLKGLLEKVERRSAEGLAAVKELDEAWEPARRGIGLELVALFETISYTSRWIEQLREAMLRLEP